MTSLAAMLPEQLSGRLRDEMLIAAETGLLLLSNDLGYRRLPGFRANQPL